VLSLTVHLKRKVVEFLIGARVSFVVCPVLKLLVEQSPEDNGLSRAMMAGFKGIHEPTCSIKDSSSEVVRIELIVSVVFLLTVSPSAPCLVNSTSHTLMDLCAHEASLDSIPEHLPSSILGRMCVVLGVRTSSVVVAVKIPPGNILSFGTDLSSHTRLIEREVVASVMLVFVNRAGHVGIVAKSVDVVKSRCDK